MVPQLETISTQKIGLGKTSISDKQIPCLQAIGPYQFAMEHTDSPYKEKGQGGSPKMAEDRTGRPLFMKRSSTFTKQLLNAGKGHQVPRKAAQYLQKEVGENIKDENRDKRFRERDPSWEGSRERDVSTLLPQPCLWGVLELQRAT